MRQIDAQNISNWLSKLYHRHSVICAERSWWSLVGVPHSVQCAVDQHSLIDVFTQGGYTVVATDDAKLIRRLRAAGIPFTVTALLIHGQDAKR